MPAVLPGRHEVFRKSNLNKSFQREQLVIDSLQYGMIYAKDKENTVYRSIPVMRKFEV